MNKNILIGIGSNIGNSIKNCRAAIKRISSDKRVTLKVVSSFYTTSPVSDMKQDDFINCVILVCWEGTPKELLGFLLNIEICMGRVREIKNGPRIIDLDILLFGDIILDEPFLTIPHKELHKRKFALVPCLEIDPDHVHPVYNKPLNHFLPTIGNDQIITKLPVTGFIEESEEV